MIQTSSLHTTKWLYSILIILYGAGAIFVFTLAWLPVQFVIDHFYYEDFFYYLKVAENIVLGQGSSLDGEATTNGFHPLWMLAIILIQAITNPDLAVHITLSLAALLHLGQVYLLFYILEQSANKVIAHFAAIFYLFNYRIIACNLCGLETPLVAFFILGIIYFLIKYHHLTTSTSWAIKLGIFLGFAILSRFDILMLIGIILAWILIDSRFGKYYQQRISTAFIVGIFSGLILLPWFIWSVINSATLLPNSNAALKVWAFSGINLQQVGVDSVLSLLIRKIFTTAWWLSDTANLLGLWPIVLPTAYKSWPALLVFIVFIIIAWGLWLIRSSQYTTFRSVLLVYATAHFSYYSLFANAQVRYLIPFVIIIMVLAAMLIAELLQRINTQKVKRMALFFYFVILTNSLLAGWFAWQQHQGATRTHIEHADLYQTANWIRNHLPENIIIGSWNAGILSYYSQRTVVNLDGVMNDAAIEVLKQKKLSSYIEHRHISFLIDLESEINKFMNRFSGQVNWRKNYVELYRLGHIVVLKKISI